MKEISLKNLCNMNSGGTPSRRNSAYYKGSIPWAKISDLEATNDGFIHSTEEHITQDALKSINNRFFDKDTLFLALYGSVGKTAISKIPMSTNQAILGISIKEPSLLDLNYLNYWFKKTKQDLVGKAVGVALKNISKGLVQELKIPLPPLAVQKRITEILDFADAYRQKTKALIEKYDELAQNIFLEMFGDPVTNPKGWEMLKLEDLGKLDRGKSQHRPRNAPELLGGDHPLIQTGDIAKASVYLKKYNSTYSDFGLSQSKKWKSGTMCITIAANIGKSAILKFDACFPDSVVGFIPNEKTKVEYVQYWLSFLQKSIENSAPESAQKNINLRILRDLKIPYPQIGFQKKFSKCIELIEMQKENAQFAVDSAEELFKSLLQRAFKGELVTQADIEPIKELSSHA